MDDLAQYVEIIKYCHKQENCECNLKNGIGCYYGQIDNILLKGNLNDEIRELIHKGFKKIYE